MLPISLLGICRHRVCFVYMCVDLCVIEQLPQACNVSYKVSGTSTLHTTQQVNIAREAQQAATRVCLLLFDDTNREHSLSAALVMLISNCDDCPASRVLQFSDWRTRHAAIGSKLFHTVKSETQMESKFLSCFSTIFAIKVFSHVNILQTWIEIPQSRCCKMKSGQLLAERIYF
jgi:hypothetical protein